MKIVAIVCSPRKGGNTEILAREVLDSASKFGAETEIININDKNIKPCDGCESCEVTRKCHIDDDMQEIYSKLFQSDGIIFASPVYFWGITAQGKAVIDRTFVFKKHKALRNKVAGSIVVANRTGASSAFSALNAFINLHMMIPARSIRARTEEEELINERGSGVIAYGNKKGDVRSDTRAIDEAQALGKAMVETMRLVNDKK
ncbi:flavodoxin family protein [Chloroflexota bacterium]